MGEKKFVVIKRWQAKEGKREELLRLIKGVMSQAGQANDENQPLQIDVLQTVENSNLILHYETWKNRQMHDWFVMGEAHSDFSNRADSLIEKIPAPEHFHLVASYTGSPESTPQKRFVENNSNADQDAAPFILVDRDSDALSPEVQKAFAAVPMRLRIFELLANAETAFPPLIDLVNVLLNNLKLNPRLRELVILRVARLAVSEYEWQQHKSMASQAGLRDDQIAAIGRGETDAVIFNEDERLVLQLATEGFENIKVSQEIMAATRNRFSPQETVELLLLTGFYAMMGGIMRSCNLPLESATKKE